MPRSRSEAARAKVISAALKHLSECGVDGFTIDAASKESGVAKTTIYRHWASGNHLLVEAIDSLIEPIPTPDNGSLRADLIEMYVSFSRIMSKPVMLRLMLGVLARSANDDAFRSVKNDFVKERHHPIQTVVQSAIDRGELPPLVDIDMAVDLIEGPFAARRLLRGESIPEDRIPHYVDAVLRALGVASPSPHGAATP